MRHAVLRLPTRNQVTQIWAMSTLEGYPLVASATLLTLVTLDVVRHPHPLGDAVGLLMVLVSLLLLNAQLLRKPDEYCRSFENWRSKRKAP